jgi:tetratricopeptide (TPR) repeat protein
MRIQISRALVIIGCGVWLTGCGTAGNLAANSDSSKASAPAAYAMASPSDTAGAFPEPLGVPAAAEPGLLGSEPHDDLSEGKKQYRGGNYGLAERYFRRAVEQHPRDAEAWLGLAAAYDRLRRFDLADRAYAQAIGIIGPTAEIMNNQGFSYMLRGDTQRARQTLLAAQRKEPDSIYVANNLRLLDDSVAKGKAIE